MDYLKARFGRAVLPWPALLLAAGVAMVLTISPASAADPASLSRIPPGFNQLVD